MVPLFSLAGGRRGLARPATLPFRWAWRSWKGGFQHHGSAPGADRGDLRQGRRAEDLRVHAVKEMANFYFYLEYFFASNNCCTKI